MGNVRRVTTLCCPQAGKSNLLNDLVHIKRVGALLIDDDTQFLLARRHALAVICPSPSFVAFLKVFHVFDVLFSGGQPWLIT